MLFPEVVLNLTQLETYCKVSTIFHAQAVRSLKENLAEYLRFFPQQSFSTVFLNSYESKRMHVRQ